jgi:hypothetical protein
MTPEAIKTVIDVGVASGLLESKASSFTFEQIVDTRPLQIAMDLLGGPVSAEDVLAGKVPAPKGG